MPSGGHARSGPPPDPTSLRSAKAGDWVVLPAGERTDPAPDWPLTPATDRELTLWERWWRKPEAALWANDGSEDYVALTVRMFAEAEVEKASAENRKTVRMMMADLYLTRDAKARARIRIAADETAERRAAKPAAAKSSRSRMKVVPGGDA